MKSLFVDMDGTLYRFHDDILDEDGVVQIEKMYEDNYFVNLKTFNNMIKALTIFHEEHPEVPIYILSAAEPGDPPGFIRQKNEVIDRDLPFIDKKHRLFPNCGVNKAEFVAHLLGFKQNLLMEDCLLLDDYNKNLREWERNGGTPVKFVNNINNKGLGAYGGDVGYVWKGEMIYFFDNPSLLSDMLYKQLIKSSKNNSVEIYTKCFSPIREGKECIGINNAVANIVLENLNVTKDLIIKYDDGTRQQYQYFSHTGDESISLSVEDLNSRFNDQNYEIGFYEEDLAIFFDNISANSVGEAVFIREVDPKYEDWLNEWFVTGSQVPEFPGEKIFEASKPLGNEAEAIFRDISEQSVNNTWRMKF